jgi:DNA polymerase III sliding clamp (beta) subunit (PCNA family)
MKLAIDQKVLIRALERGAMSALSDEAQGDTSSFSRLIKSVKITVTKDNFTVESGTNLLATKWSMKATKENGVEVKEEGTILVPAKELFGWASKQNKAKIALTLSKLKVPEIIKNNDGDSDSDNDYGSGSSISIKKIGTLRLVSRDDSKTGNKWNLDCYDPDQTNSVDFSKAPDKVVQIPSPQLSEALKNVAFSSQPKDYQHIFDSIVIERFNGKVYMAASDCHRCSIYHLDQATEVDEKFFTETSKATDGMVHGQKVLIPSVFLKGVSKIVEGSEIAISYDKAKGKVYLDADDWKIRIATVDSKMFNKFPTVALLMDKKYDKLGSIPKGILTNRLVSASLVNKAVVLFDFSKDDNKGDSVIIHAISESGHAPNVSNAPVNNLVKDIKAVWGVQHLMDVAKVIKDDDVNLMIPDDLRSVKVVSEEDPNLAYYAMVIKNDKYAHFFEED